MQIQWACTICQTCFAYVCGHVVFPQECLGAWERINVKPQKRKKHRNAEFFKICGIICFCRIADFVFVPELKICKNGWFRKTAAVFWLRRVCKKCGVDVFSIIGELKTHMFGRFWNILFWGICIGCFLRRICNNSLANASLLGVQNMPNLFCVCLRKCYLSASIFRLRENRRNVKPQKRKNTEMQNWQNLL